MWLLRVSRNKKYDTIAQCTLTLCKDIKWLVTSLVAMKDIPRQTTVHQIPTHDLRPRVCRARHMEYEYDQYHGVLSHQN